MTREGLTIILDRVGSGKSQALLDAIAQEGLAGRQMLIVPEHISHQAERDVCSACGDHASRHVTVASFRWLASDILSRTGGIDEVPLDQGGCLLTMHRAIQKNQELLSVYRRPSQRAAFLEQLLNLHDEMRTYCVTPAELLSKKECVSEPLGDKLGDIALIFNAYDAMLNDGRRDRRDFMERFMDQLDSEEMKSYFRGVHVYVDGFLYFNAREEEILRRIMLYAESVTVALMGDPERSDGVFALTQNVANRLLDIANREHIKKRKIASPYREETHRTPALAHLETYFFGMVRPFEGETEGLHLRKAQTTYDEVEQVASEIHALVAAGKCRYRDILVAARNMADYEATIENVFERYEVPVFLNRSRDILEKPVIALLLSALDTVTGRWEYEDVFSYLKTGMAGITKEQCDILENYVLKWDIRGSMWTKNEAWTAHPDGYDREVTERSTKQLEWINKIRARVTRPLLQLKSGVCGVSGAETKIRGLYQFLVEIHLPEQLAAKTELLQERGEQKLAEEYAQLWKLLCDVMDQFVLILEDTPLDEREFSHLLKLILTQYDIGTIPVALDQVSITEITRNERHPYKYEFFLGANDHVLPAVGSGVGVLTDGDRSELSQENIMMAPFGIEQMHMELLNLYAAMAQATESLTVSYPSADLSGSELRPAFIVGRIQKLFPELKLETTDEQRLLGAKLPALEMAGRKNYEELRTYFEENENTKRALEGMEQAAAWQRGRLSEAVVKTLYGEHIRMSASRMDQINQCHFSFFMKYGLKAKERRKAGLDAPEIGTFLHYLLENIAREAKERGGFDRLDEATRTELVKTYVARFVEESLGGMAHKTARFRYLFKRLEKTACSIVDDVANELAASDFVPMAFELEFGEEGKVPALHIETKETALTVGGKVDRVDGWVNNGKLYLRVVDYKTGKKKFDLAELLHGVGAQMLLYLFTLERHGEKALTADGLEIVPAGVEYIPARDAILNLGRNTSDAEIRLAMEKELKRSGMFLYNAEVLEAMEHGCTKEPHFLPLSIKKDGSITDGVASAAQIGKLSLYVDKLLKNIAQELGRGNIDADPNYRSEEKNACAYCPFATACHFEEGRGRDHREYISSVKEEEFWETVDRITAADRKGE